MVDERRKVSHQSRSRSRSQSRSRSSVQQTTQSQSRSPRPRSPRSRSRSRSRLRSRSRSTSPLNKTVKAQSNNKHRLSYPQRTSKWSQQHHQHHHQHHHQRQYHAGPAHAAHYQQNFETNRRYASSFRGSAKDYGRQHGFRTSSGAFLNRQKQPYQRNLLFKPESQQESSSPSINVSSFLPSSLVASSYVKPCSNCTPEMNTYPEHELFASFAGNRILGTRANFCEGLFHMFPAAEFGSSDKKHGTIFGNGKDSCRPYSLTLVAICGSLTARFTNCRRKHAEEFLVNNDRLRSYIVSEKPKELKLYMKHHPCHHSGGNSDRSYHHDSRSCTQHILKFYDSVLKPNNVRLSMRFAWLYKAFWKNATSDDDVRTVKNSLTGLRMLLDHDPDHIDVDGFQLHEWVLMANLTSEPIELCHLLCPMRCKVDYHVRQFIAKQKDKQTREQTQ